KFACEKADKVIVVSKQTADDIVRFLRIPERKIEVVYQGCHQNFKKAIKQEEIEKVTKKYQLPPSYMLTVGTIEKRKNIGLILEFLNNHPDYLLPLVVVGRPTHYLEELVAYTEDSGLEDRVMFLHQVSCEYRPVVYAGAYVFSYPPIFGRFGIPIIEAQE